MGAGSQVSDLEGWLPPLSTLLCDVWLTFCCLAALWVSSSWAGWDLPVSTTSFPFCFLFLFGSARSGLGGKEGWGGRRGDLGGGGGNFGYADFSGASLPGCDSIKSIKLLWFFLYMPIFSKVMMSTCCWESMSADISSEEGSWLNTSNSSKDSDKVTIPFRFSSSSSSSSSWRTG